MTDFSVWPLTESSRAGICFRRFIKLLLKNVDLNMAQPVFSLACTYKETFLVDTYFAKWFHKSLFFNAYKALLKASITWGNGSSGHQLKAKMGHLSGELSWGLVTPRSPFQVTVLELSYVCSWEWLAPSLFNRGVKLETIKSYLIGRNYMEPQRIQPYFFYHLYCFQL